MTELRPLPRSMALGELLDLVGAQASSDSAWQDITVSGLSLDTRALSHGDAYLALPGRATHGMDHAAAAEAAGAVVILTVSGAAQLNVNVTVPVVEVSELPAKINALADAFFGGPGDELLLVAVTGTDGKTSVCRFVADAFSSIGKSAGYIGTIGWGLVDGVTPLDTTALTTPDAIALRHMLRAMADAGADTVALEASSHGIAEGRLDGLPIDIAVLTNIGRDHLDYHGTESAYREAKARLFDWPSLSGIVVNADDSLGQALVARHVAGSKTSQRLATFSITGDSEHDAEVQLLVRDISTTAAGIHFTLDDTGATVDVSSRLLGRFNVDNLLACHAVLRLSGVSVKQSVEAIQSLSPVPGRMDRVDGGTGTEPVVIVDYAHTPNALRAALSAARAHCQGKLIVVFGCGGDRDAGKRAPMGQAARAADKIIVTDDNPRHEDSAAIIDAILLGLVDQPGVHVHPDRSHAIEQALRGAGAKDVVLIAGKGHEDYQIVGEQRLAFSDHSVARDALRARTGRVERSAGEVHS